MLKKLLSTIFKTGKTVHKSTKKSSDFIDELLEKEYISGTVDNLKTSSGKIVEKAGQVYQKTKDQIENHVDTSKIQELGDKLKEKGQDLSESIAENMQESAATIKNVIKEGEKIVKDLLEEE